MQKIFVEQIEEKDNAWIFQVVVGEEPDATSHVVTVPREYWKKLANGKDNPADFVRKSFEFLLEREPKEAILREFELSVISRYFPEYEEEIINT